MKNLVYYKREKEEPNFIFTNLTHNFFLECLTHNFFLGC